MFNWTSQFNLAAFLSLQDKNFKKSSFTFPIDLDLCSPFSKMSCDFCHCKNHSEGGWTWLATALLWCCIFVGSGIKLPEKYPFYSPLLFIQHCWRSNRDRYKLISGSWYATWNISHTHTYVWAPWVGTKAQAQNCLFHLYYKIYGPKNPL